MSNISISVIIPNYNHATYLPQALNAVLQQTIAPDEIIIVDDCSTDDSISVLEDYLKTYPNIKLIQNSSNQGVFAAISRGLHAASSTHVLFAAADDWIENSLIENAKRDLTRYQQAGLWSCGSWSMYSDKLPAPTRMHYPLTETGFIEPTKAQDLLLRLESWFMGNTVVLNRSYLLQEGGFNPSLRSFSDNFMYRVLAAKYGCCFNPAKLSTWRINQNGYAMSNNTNINNQKDIINAVNRILTDEYRSLFSAKLQQRTLKRLNFNLARLLWLTETNNTNQLELVLQQYYSKISLRCLWLPFLRLLRNLPGLGYKLGNLLLFILIRPFDIFPAATLHLREILHKRFNFGSSLTKNSNYSSSSVVGYEQ